MSDLPQVSEQFLRLAEMEERMDITVGAPWPFTRGFPILPPTQERLALAKLVELQRRSLGLTPVELAERTNVSYLDLLRLEEGVVTTPMLGNLPIIARELQLPEKVLLELASAQPDPTGRIRQAAEAFVARTAPTTRPTPEETDALTAFVHALAANGGNQAG
jgi:transcriptional regulator with XRE-family HTH domain